MRGITGCGDILESTSNGFVIDPSPPSLEVISTGYRAIGRAQSTDGDAPADHEAYQATAQFSSVWRVGDEESGVTDDVMVKTGTYPGGADIESERAVSENYIRGFLTDEEGLPNYITVSAQNRASLESVAISDSVALDTSSPLGGEVCMCDILNVYGNIFVASNPGSHPAFRRLQYEKLFVLQATKYWMRAWVQGYIFVQRQLKNKVYI